MFPEQDDANDQKDDAPADRRTEDVDLAQQERSPYDKQGGTEPWRGLEAVEQIAPVGPA
jgi:hypothetical protein